MTEPTTMIQELKTRILNGGMISRGRSPGSL